MFSTQDPFGPAPFGRSKSSSQPKVWASKARRLFDSHPQLAVEDKRSDYTGTLMRVKHTDAPPILEAHRDPGPDKGRSVNSVARHRLATSLRYHGVHKKRDFAAVPAKNRQKPIGPYQTGRLHGLFCRTGFSGLFSSAWLELCVGMAWPPPGPDVQLETPLVIEPLGLTQSDMYQGNIMFGRLHPEEAGHSRVPVVRNIKTERDYEDIEGYDGLESNDTLEHIVSTFILDADTY
ncbi:hypothetical protein DL765_001971 [Monosporascus sp. GIB2]|nr:hypothetical protein DL765_001971 [Monosporascus sp. GIB2]